MADENDDIKAQVAARVRASESGKEYKDTDVVNYTRKYTAQYDIVTSTDLSKIEADNVTAYKLIEKGKIWPVYNVEDLKAAGNSSGAAYTKVKLREALSSRPLDSKDARETYVRSIEKLRSGLDACKTSEAVFEFLKIFIDLDKFDFGTVPDTIGKASYLSTSYVGNLKNYSSRDLQNYFENIFGKRFIGFCKASSEGAIKVKTEARLIEEFTPFMEAAAVEQRWNTIQKNIATYKALKAAVQAAGDSPAEINAAIRSVEKYATVNTYVKSELIDFYDQYIAKAEARTRESIVKDLPAYFRARPDDWSWAGGKKEKAEATKVDQLDKVAKSAETIFEKYGIEDWKKQTKRIPLAYIKRTGGLAVQDIAVNEVTDKFGYRNVVFGNYVKNDERKENLRHFLGAMLDLHEIINLDVKEINKLGGLDINFGSTGCGAFSGAMACYFPQLKAINLTKKAGDGSLAHEWSHYLDNVLGEGTARLATKQNYATYGKEVLNNAEKIKVLFSEYLNWLKTGGEERMIDVRYPAQRKYRFRIVGNTPEEAIAYVQKTYPKYGKYENAHDPDIIKYFGYIAHKLNNNQKITVPLHTRMTEYMAICEQYSGGGDYWNNSKEIFARAFAWFVEDALKQKNRVSNYLVDNKAGMGLAGMLFPESEWPFPYKESERAFLRDWFDRLFSAIRTEYNIQPFHWDTVERADEYSEYAPDKNAKIEAGVIVEGNGSTEAVGDEIQNFPGGKSFRAARVAGETVYQMLVREKPTKLFIKNTKKVGWEIYAKQDDGTNTKLHPTPFKTLRAAQEYVVENELEAKQNTEMKTFDKEEPTGILGKSYHVRDTLVNKDIFNSLPADKQAEITRLTEEFQKLGYIDARTELGPDQIRRMSEKQKNKMAETASAAFAIENKIKQLLKSDEQVGKEEKSERLSELKGRKTQLISRIQNLETIGFLKKKIDSPRANATKTDYQQTKAELEKVDNEIAELEGNKKPEPVETTKTESGKTISTKDDAVVSIAEYEAPLHKTYTQAIKLPKGGAVAMDDDNLQATAADIISRKHGMRAEAIYDWANKHGIILKNYGHILSDIKVNSELLEDVLGDKFEATKELLEPGIKPTVPTSKKTTIAPGELPKTGEHFTIHMPELGQFPAKDIELAYDPNNFTFIIYQDGKKAANIGEKQIIENFANGLYEWPASSTADLTDKGTIAGIKFSRIHNAETGKTTVRMESGDYLGGIVYPSVKYLNPVPDNELPAAFEEIKKSADRKTKPQENEPVTHRTSDTPALDNYKQLASKAREKVRNAKSMSDLNAANHDLAMFEKRIAELEAPTYTNVKACLLADGDNENDFIVEGTKIYAGNGDQSQSWEVVQLSNNGATLKYNPASILDDQKPNKELDYAALRKLFEEKKITIPGIETVQVFNHCIKAIKTCLDKVDQDAYNKEVYAQLAAAKAELEALKAAAVVTPTEPRTGHPEPVEGQNPQPGTPTTEEYKDSLAGAEISLEFEEDATRKQELADYIDGLKLLIESTDEPAPPVKKKTTRLEKLEAQKSELESKFYAANLEENEKLSRRGWGHAMRNVKIGFSTRKSDGLKERIKTIDEKIAALKDKSE